MISLLISKLIYANTVFALKEVFMSEFYDSVQVRRLVGKCYVLFVKDYFDIRPKVS